MADTRGRRIAIVGAGFSGSLLAVHLLRRATPSGMHVGNDGMNGIEHRDWQTISNLDADGNASLIAPKRVTFA